jgi:hypothetical protein
MLHISLILPLFIFSSIALTPNSQRDHINYDLGNNSKYKIKSIVELEYYYKGKEITSPNSTYNAKWVSKFDRRGNLKKFQHYGERGTRITKTDNYYDSKGHKTKGVYFNYNVGVQNKEIIEFNDDGDMVKRYYFIKNDSLMNVEFWSYKTKAKPIKRDILYKLNGKVEESRLYVYDSLGLLIEEKVFLPADKIHKILVYKYDLKRNLIDFAGYKVNGDLDFKVSKKYNLNNDLIEASYYSSTEELSNKEITEFDSLGKKIKEIEYKSNSGVLYVSSESWFNYHSNLERRILYKPNGTKDEEFLHKYEYDNYGNWILLKFYCNGELCSTTFRRIKYYNF